MADGGWARALIADRAAQRAALVDSAGQFVAALPDRIGLVAAVVFGSVARGDFNAWSDVDVLVVAEWLPERVQDRLALLIDVAPPGVQPVGWTPNEFRHQFARGDPIALEALARGVVLTGEEALRALAAEAGRR